MIDLAPPSTAGAVEAAARFAAAAPADVFYARIDSPVGPLVAARTERGLARLAYEDFNGGLDRVLDDLAGRLSPRILEGPAKLDDVRRELEEYFAGRRTRFDLPLDLSVVRGAFGRRILRACAAIPYGEVSSYRAMATAAGSANAVRAAGNALGHNPIPIVVPCHRVLRSGGALGGYTGGLERKEQLLRIEGSLH
jgi:methylated-DNA-[protein]-cysteine S-methyltransferase